jgi:surface protein
MTSGVSKWDVLSVPFNGDIPQWDVSSATNMEDMFYRVSLYHGDISRWDVPRVTNMDSMFYSASSFNGDITKWDVSEVANMWSMFYRASTFYWRHLEVGCVQYGTHGHHVLS